MELVDFIVEKMLCREDIFKQNCHVNMLSLQSTTLEDNYQV